MSTAYCYVTDGRDDAEMRKWSVASLRRYCGDVPVFTVTAKGLYAPSFDGETVLDMTEPFRRTFGDVEPTRRCTGNSAFPALVFGKFVLPFVPELSAYDTIVTLEADIEIVRPEFGTIADIRLPDDADVGLVRGTNVSQWKPVVAARHPRRWFAGSTYHSTGMVLMRGGWRTTTYMERLREMFRASMDERFFLPEEYAANMFLSVFTLPSAYHVIPEVKEAKRSGAVGEALDKALALHYGGPRKRCIRARWKEQYETGGTVDVHNLTGRPK